MTKDSILSRARSEGYRDGIGQASQVAHDKAHHEGWQQGRRDAPTAQRFILGLFIGSVMGYLTGIFIS